MKISFDSIKPIYLQIAEGIADDIIEGRLEEGNPAYSQLVIAKELDINPATAAKGINVLVQKGILIKQRGLPMIVASGARDELLKERRENRVEELSEELVEEAKRVGMSCDELNQCIFEIYNKH